ncbi:biotin-dependent carboxyltransferase family protein [Staphylococcus haemolyticus]|uniref:5-oxoprolinase subunit C family protein n=1 Tax=Staphylococcus haemolyticus TaxID=1283 RepID=UPI001C6786ED|nr:biotin-dependent carboxyltransferase family protein [Staphylococcus haemolyticus]MBW5905481.1 biotin-dependent carboxyltransferase family protein [Staphylococcus haemolyticus]
MGIKILKPGLFTIVQDKGRFGYQHLGFSGSGAMDQFSYNLGRKLIGNSGPSLEFTIIGPTLTFTQANTFVITGGQFNAKLNDINISNNNVLLANKGDVLEFGPAIKGARGYIFFGHPLDIEMVAGSYSTHTRSKIGGFNGRALKKDDHIQVVQNSNFKVNLGKTSDYDAIEQDNIIHIIEGPQVNAFSHEKRKTLVESVYKISDQSDRMGYRLIGDNIPPDNGADIISEPVGLGSIQVPNDGNPIILLNDKQTVGGYTKIATVSQLDLKKLAQFKPGDVIQFKWISVDEANAMLKNFNQQFEEKLESVTKAPIFNMHSMRATSKKLAKLIEEEK